MWNLPWSGQRKGLSYEACDLLVTIETDCRKVPHVNAVTHLQLQMKWSLTYCHLKICQFFLAVLWFSMTRCDLTDFAGWKDFFCICMGWRVVMSDSAFNHKGESFCTEPNTSERNQSLVSSQLIYTVRKWGEKKRCLWRFDVLIFIMHLQKCTFNMEFEKKAKLL